MDKKCKYMEPLCYKETTIIKVIMSRRYLLKNDFSVLTFIVFKVYDQPFKLVDCKSIGDCFQTNLNV